LRKFISLQANKIGERDVFVLKNPRTPATSQGCPPKDKDVRAETTLSTDRQ